MIFAADKLETMAIKRGKHCVVFPGVTIGEGTRLGNFVLIRGETAIGREQLKSGVGWPRPAIPQTVTNETAAERSPVQILGEEMASRYGFLGVPRETFDRAGRLQFIALLREGLSPESTVVDIGCGALRAAYWLIRFLDPDRYCGIEPARDRVEHGCRHLFSPDLLREKQPRFDFNPDFDTSVFGSRFDFFLAGSIFSHAAKKHIRVMLDGFLRNSSERGIFLASYCRATAVEEDYRGDHWVGTSHESNTPGVIRQSLDWVEAECRSRGLVANEIPGEAFDGQTWLRIHRRGPHPNPEYLRFDDLVAPPAVIAGPARSRDRLLHRIAQRLLPRGIRGGASAVTHKRAPGESASHAVGAPDPATLASGTKMELDLADFAASSGTIAWAGDGGIEVATAATPWAYAAVLPLPTRALSADGARRGYVRIRVEVEGGPIGFGVVNQDKTQFLDRRALIDSNGVVDVFLTILRISHAADVIVQTWERAASGTARIQSVSLIIVS